tara:strand:+ start:149 stop:382 length:234 start_codon:yes stop_codon:yes gene_type:complete
MMWTFGSEATAEAKFMTMHGQLGMVYNIVFTSRSVTKRDLAKRLRAMRVDVIKQGWNASGIDWSDSTDKVFQIWRRD